MGTVPSSFQQSDDDRPVEPGSGVVGRIVTGGRLPLVAQPQAMEAGDAAAGARVVVRA